MIKFYYIINNIQTIHLYIIKNCLISTLIILICFYSTIFFLFNFILTYKKIIC